MALVYTGNIVRMPVLSDGREISRKKSFTTEGTEITDLLNKRISSVISMTSL
jgi:hypothetical protein